MSGNKPSRVVAAVLSVFGAGLGHAHLGAWRRALAWALAPAGAFALVSLLVASTRAAFSLFVPAAVLFFFARFVALMDVFLVPEARLRRTSFWLVIGFWIGLIAFEVIGALALRVTVLQAFKIPSASMKPTLLVQDHIMVAKGPFRRRTPRRGELVVFSDPDDPREDFVKRVIGLPGDEVAVNGTETRINGFTLPRCVIGRDVSLPGMDADGFTNNSRGTLELEYVDDASYLVFFDEERGADDRPRTWRVSPDDLFVIGDNRNNSADSRSFSHGSGGGVPLALVHGEPLFIWLAFTPRGEVDWSRVNLRLDAPHLPRPLAALEPALRTCLGSRPSSTVPPPPK